MSRKITADHVTRGDLPSIPPDQIVVDHDQNTRLYTPDISDLKASFKSQGQLQACVVRPLPDGKVQLVAGYRRWLTAMSIWEDQKKAGTPEAERFKLKVEVQKMNAAEALDRNIIENVERASLSPIENAHAIRRLRNEHGWDNPEGTIKIANMFRKSQAWVGEIEQLLSLAEDERFQVHKHFVTQGEEGISQTVAQILAKIPEDRRTKALEEARSNSMSGKVNDPDKKKRSPSTRAMADAAANNGAVVLRGRQVKDLLDYIDTWFDGSKIAGEPEKPTAEFLRGIQAYMSRTIDERKLDKLFSNLDAFVSDGLENLATQKANKKAGSK